MNKVYAQQWALDISDKPISNLLNDHEKIIRLSPQWDVKEIRTVGGVEPNPDIELDIEYDRTETPVSFKGNINKSLSPDRLKIFLTSQSNSLDFTIEASDLLNKKLLSVRIESFPEPDINDIREFDLWARSIVNYLKVSASRRWHIRLWKTFLDRWWLNMTQSAKRITFFIVVSEGFSVIFLVALLFWWRYF